MRSMRRGRGVRGYLRIWLGLCLAMGARLVCAEPVLVSTDWVARHLGDPDLVLVDMAVEPIQYRRFHLPGARYLPYDSLVARGRDGISRRIPDRALFERLGAAGISSQTLVVIYDDIGGLQASRLFWELERIGHPRVSVMDGGLVRWVLERRRVVGGVPRVKGVSYTPPAGGGRANGIDLAGMEAVIPDPDVILLDVRSPEEYRGKAKVPRSGHIPGARSWPWRQAVDFEHGFTLRPAGEILSSLRGLGIGGRGADLVLYCHSGHRAAHTYMTLRHLGFERLRLYDGSMAEYARYSNLPLRKGDTP